MLLESSPSPFMDDLPDEIVLEIISQLQLIRKNASATPANPSMDLEEDRYEENLIRKKALWSLCLTSRRVSSIAQSILYSSFILDLSTRPEKCPTSLLLHTIITKPHLARYIQYIENRIEDAVAARDDPNWPAWRSTAQLHHSLLRSRAEEIWGSTFSNEDAHWARRLEERPDEAEFALLIALAPNLRHLYLASLECFRPSIWDFVGFKMQNGVYKPRQYPRLKSLCIELEERDGWISGGDWFRQLAEYLIYLPGLKYLHTNGMFCKSSALALPAASLSLESIYLSNCNLDLREICDLVRACKTLKHFACHYRSVDFGPNEFDLSNLRDALSSHAHTIESLYLDVRQAAIRHSVIGRIHPLGALSSFSVLKDVTFCTTSMYGDPADLEDLETYQRIPYWNYHSPPYSISSALPPNIENLTIIPGTYIQKHTAVTTGFPALGDFLRGCREFERLRGVRVALMETGWSGLEKKFKEKGIAFEECETEYLPSFVD